MVKKISFNEIYPFWKNFLWPDRKSEIKPTNGIKFLGGFDRKIEKNIPTFFGVFVKNELVGVNSGYSTGDGYYRSRGLYVLPEYRRNSLAQMLLYRTQEQSLLEGNNKLWSMPRVSALTVYLRFGFIKVSKFFEDDVEFGPNCFVIKRL